MILEFENNDIWAKDDPEDKYRYLVVDADAKAYLLRLRDQMQAQKWRDLLSDPEETDDA